MTFMISCRQPLTFLKKATEIKVDYKDIARLADFVTEEWVCQAPIVIYIPKDQVVNWNEINNYKDILNIAIAVEDTGLINSVQEYGYRVFWSYPVSTYAELNSLIKLGVNEVLLDGPLYFNLPRVKAICGEDIELRLVVNKCFNNYIPLDNGVCGTYVRPEDIDAYSVYIDHFEFDTKNDLKKEHILHTIYAEDKNWPGNLNLLLTNLYVDVDNRGFELVAPEDDKKFFAHRRMTCGQKCWENNICHYCLNTMNFINALQKFAEKK